MNGQKPTEEGGGGEMELGYTGNDIMILSCRGWVLRVFMNYWQCCSLQRLSGGICPCWQRSRPGELRGDYQEDQGNNEWQEDGAQVVKDGVKEGNSCHRFFGAMNRVSGAKNILFCHPKRFFASMKWICPFNYSTMSCAASSSLMSGCA